MKRDLDSLMKKMAIEAIFAQGSASSDPVMYYLLNGVNVTGTYIKKCNAKAYFIHSPIEREEAAKTHLKLLNMNRFDVKNIHNKYKDKLKANARYIKMIFDELKVSGRIAFYGNTGLGAGYNLLRQLRNFNKKITVCYEPGKDLLTRARQTKDAGEIKRIKKVGDGVVEAFKTVLKEVQAMSVENNIIIKPGGKKLLIRDLKEIIRNELFKKGFINSVGLIVAQARDAGVPHNSGQDRAPIKLGKTVVFDIFPQEMGGGYFFDFTRTVCFGYAAKRLKEIYRLVCDAQDYAFELLKVGKKTRDIEAAVCKFFKEHNQPTFLTDPKTQIGYCHSLGHGLGLNVHESPAFGLVKTNFDCLKPGMVFTVEPGLYYPDEGFGIRLEDVIYVAKKGRIINLTSYPRKLVVEM